MSQGLPLKDKLCVRARTRTESFVFCICPYNAAPVQELRLIMFCLPLCSMCACCDLSVVLAQTASRVDSEPVINRFRQSQAEKPVKTAQNVQAAQHIRVEKEFCVCLWRRTQYTFAPCSWSPARSADSTQRSHACRCVVVHAKVSLSKTQQPNSHGHFEQSERESLLWPEAGHVHASQCGCIGLAPRSAISSRVCCRRCIACATLGATSLGATMAPSHSMLSC